ncbi:MAG: GGDEF domain-containing protein [Chloroflexi bacterium]|nr:GGDEF domain-containing protein [Chloroflexota bacterium]
MVSRDNEPAEERGAGPARRVAAFLARGSRPLVIFFLALPFLLRAVGSDFHPELVALGVIYLVTSEAERRMVARVSRGHRLAVRVAFRPLYAGLVVVAAAFVVHWPWVAPVLLAMIAAHAALWLRSWGAIVVGVTASVANIAASVLCGLVLEDHTTTGGVYGVQEALLVSLVGLPLLVAVLASRAAETRSAAQMLRSQADRLRAARDELQRSQQQLQRWNRELNTEVDRQTHALDERNRYLSIINAVSFALAEPMDDGRTLERAVRLLGVRAAQAYTRPSGVEVIDLFVTVAPEDLHAPRLPESVLLEVARTGRPVSSIHPDAVASIDAATLPDLGEPYHVVPLVAKGRVLGSFALIGTGSLRDDDDGRHLLLLVGREMGVALENARLYREAIEKAAREEFLTEVTRLLNSSGRGERALPAVLDLLLRNTAASEAVLVSLPEGSRDVVVAGSACESGGESRLERLGRSLTGIVVDRARPMVLGVGGESPLSDRLAAEGYTTLAIAPILTTRGSLSPEASATTREQHEDAAVRATPSLAGALILGVTADAEWDGPQTDLLERVTDIVARRVQADEFVAVQQQRIRELTGLAEVARTMQSGADVERLYNGFALALQRLLPYEALYVPRLDDLGEVAEVPSYGLRGRPIESPPHGRGDSRHPWFSLRTPLLWRAGDAEPPGFVPVGSRYAVVVPMRPKGQMLGLAVVTLSRLIREDQLRIVEQAVEQLSLALDGAALYQQATERASHIQALSNLARIVASVVNLREAFSAFSEEVRWLIPFDRSVMFLLDEAEQRVEPYATYPDVDERSGSAPLVLSLASVPIENGTAVTFRRDDARYAHLDWSLLGEDVREVAAVPVRQGNRTSAVFALVSNTHGAYGAGELSALDEVAGLLAVTIERLRLYEHADHSAKHDLLTGLPNYRYLQERLGELRSGISRAGRSALLVVDMDSLKLFNDTLGHEVGDRVIQTVADVLRSACCQDDFVARTGGDEFVILMEDADAEAAVAVADRVHAALREAHREVDGAPTRIGVSVGVAVAPDDANSTADLLHAADQAMYEAKFAGGQRTRTVSERVDVVEPLALRARGTRNADTLIRALVAGASPEEVRALSLAQRWAGAILGRLNLPPEYLPELRLVLAGDASDRFSAPRRDRDQILARHLVTQVRAEWTGIEDIEVREPLTVLAQVLLEASWLTIPDPDGPGCEGEEALERVATALLDMTLLPVWAVIVEAVRATGERRKRQAA